MPFFLPFIPAAAAALPPVVAAAAGVVAAAGGITSSALYDEKNRSAKLEDDLKAQSESFKNDLDAQKSQNLRLVDDLGAMTARKEFLEKDLQEQKESLNLQLATRQRLEQDLGVEKCRNGNLNTENENLKVVRERLEQDLTGQRLQNENLERQRLDQQAAISNLTNAANVMSTNMSAMNADMNTMNADMDAKMTMMLQMMLQMNQRMNGLPMPPAGTLGIESPMKPLVAIKGCEYVTSASGERTATAESEVLVTTADDKPNDEVPNDIESTMDHEVFVKDSGPAMMNDKGAVDIIHGSIKGPQESCVAAGDVIFSF
ncbi:hypothetical protein B0O80DRAFT_499296 [Mortierella sp. GBAus27b]|nr:hypothetical protein B0O80DRAFT_499296 [Mortierella sp. GBAus27b]